MRIVIVGIGKVGRALAEHLSREGHDVAVIDNRPGMAERLAEELDVLGIEGNGAAYTVQQQARASQADLVIAATSEDEVNMIACMTAKKLGAKNTIARVRSVEYESQLRFMQQEMGLSLSINPERETARDIARILRFPAVAKVETFAKGRVELVEYHIPQGSLLDGMALKNVAVFLQVKVLVCAVRRGEEVVIPDGNYVLGAGDCISVTAKPQELENFFRALGVFRDHARNVMVVGAGRITRFLAEQLSQMKMRVRVVDRDEQRCVDLSEAVPTALVIHGDATDVHLLAEEGLDDSDAFVALTGLDELNIMLAMYARCHNIECSVAKVNRNSFTELINKTAIVESTGFHQRGYRQPHPAVCPRDGKQHRRRGHCPAPHGRKPGRSPGIPHYRRLGRSSVCRLRIWPPAPMCWWAASPAPMARSSSPPAAIPSSPAIPPSSLPPLPAWRDIQDILA